MYSWFHFFTTKQVLKALCLALALGCVAACAPTEQPHVAASRGNEIAVLAPEALHMPDGATLPLRRWLPKVPLAPKAVVLALHGFNDYSHAFELPATWLATHGVAVYAYDQRGFGANQMRGIWAGKANLQRDMQHAVAALRKQHPHVPLYLMGESMGAAVIINGCVAKPEACEEVSGLILSAPALWGDDMLSGFYRASVWAMAHVIPASQWTGEDLDIQASDNIDILIAMGADPQVIKSTRVDAVLGLVRAMADAYVLAPKLTQPVLLLYGAKDEVVPPMPVAKAINGLQAPYTVGYYANGYHLLLRDLQRELVYKDVLSWIDNRYHPLPSAADMGWQEELLGVD